MADYDYDLIVIGSGPAGEKGAAQAAYFGKQVAVIEKERLREGATQHSRVLPSKTLRETALYVSGYRQRELYTTVQFSLNRGLTVNDLMCRKDTIVRADIDRCVRNLDRHGIALHTGTAHFVDAHTVEVVPADGGPPKRLSGAVILIAVGSVPHRPAGIPFNDPDIHDSDEILGMERLPQTMVVVGGGVIGCEYASMFAPLGCHVTLLEGGDRLLAFADGEMSTLMAEAFGKLDMDVRLNTRVDHVDKDGGRIRLDLKGGERLWCDQVLYCAGRTGAVGSLDLPAAGLAADPRGRIVVNEHYQTDVPHIYAAGDVIGFPALASTGMDQGRIAMCHAFDLKYKTRLSPILPLGIYTIPELSMVGETEESAKQKGLAYEVGRSWYRDNARGQITGDREGLLKLVFAPDTRKLLGCHIIGERATEIIHIASTCLYFGGAIDTFIDAVYNYPTLSELYKYAAYDGLGRLARRRAQQSQGATEASQ